MPRQVDWSKPGILKPGKSWGLDDECPIKMKITKENYNRLLKKSINALSEGEHEQDMYPGADERGDPDNWDHFYDDDDELSFEDRNRFVEAYNVIGKAVKLTTTESVGDVVLVRSASSALIYKRSKIQITPNLNKLSKRN